MPEFYSIRFYVCRHPAPGGVFSREVLPLGPAAPQGNRQQVPAVPAGSDAPAFFWIFFSRFFINKKLRPKKNVFNVFFSNQIKFHAYIDFK